LLSFAGYTAQSVYESVVGQNQDYLLRYCKNSIKESNKAVMVG
jgi:hypothetical protein